MSSFTTAVYQNEYLPVDGCEVNAILTVTSTGGAEPAQRPDAAEIVILDTSGSMDVPHGKIRAARDATRAAIDCIRDGVAFGVIAGTESAEVVYPLDGMPIPANATTRATAKREVERLTAKGGTAMGRWLELAAELFAKRPGSVCHAILLTDGENQHETPAELDAVLAACEGRFQCDCRGVGTDWQVSELRRIASVLLGTVDIIPEPAGMAADFRSMMESAMGKVTQNVSLRVWTPQGTHTQLLRQVAPTIEDLTDRGREINELVTDYPTGAWGGESRDYHVCIRVPPRGIGEEMLAARVSLVEGDVVLSQALIKAVWTDDQQLSTRINREVAHYTGQGELAKSVQEGLEARKAGDEATATFKLGRAVKLASESRNDATLRLLEAVVQVDDAATGTVRLRREVTDADEMALDTRSTKTVRIGPSA